MKKPMVFLFLLALVVALAGAATAAVDVAEDLPTAAADGALTEAEPSADGLPDLLLPEMEETSGINCLDVCAAEYEACKSTCKPNDLPCLYSCYLAWRGCSFSCNTA